MLYSVKNGLERRRCEVVRGIEMWHVLAAGIWEGIEARPIFRDGPILARIWIKRVRGERAAVTADKLGARP